MNQKLKFKTFRSAWASWDDLFQEACDFANSIDRENVLNISHTCHSNEGIVTVWYWDDEDSGRMFEINRTTFGE